MTTEPIRVLLIEDNSLDTRLVGDMLGRTKPGPFALTSSKTLSSGLSLIESEEFDILILDLGLPDSEGIQTLRAVRARAPRLPVVVFSATGDEELARLSIAEGAQDYLFKGEADRNLLVRSIHYAIGRKEIEQQLMGAHIELEERVRNRTAQLKEKNDELLEKIEELGLAQEQLSASEKRYRLLIENLADVVFNADTRGVITYVSSAVRRLFEYEPDEVIGKKFLDFVHPEDVSKTVDGLEKAVSRKKEIHHFRVVGKSGIVKHVRVSVQLSSQEREGPNLTGIITDITDRKLAEDALRESEEKYRILVDNSQEAIMVAQDGLIKFANAKLSEITGYSREELIGKYFIELIYPDDRLEIIKEYERKISGDAYSFFSIFRFLTKDNTIKWAESNGVLITWAGQQALLTFTRDVTDRRRFEEALRESEEKWRSLFENSIESAFTVDINGNFTEANHAAEILSGYRRDEMVGKNFREFMKPDQAEAVYNAYHGLFETGHPMSGALYTMIRKDGEERTVEGCVNVIREESRVVGFQGTLRDVTEKKKLEQQLIQSQKMEAVGTLAGGIAHNFNNILVGIMGYSELLLGKKKDDDADFKALRIIHEGTVRASRLTQELLNITRGGSFHPARLSVNTVVKNMLPLITGTLDKSIKVDLHLVQDLPAVKGDLGQIEQCLLNLCINARDAMPGKGRLIIETLTQKLDAEFVRTHLDAREGDYVILSVTDTGMGMSREVKERIFDPFFTTKEHIGGTGMGLSTVYGIVKNHGGLVTVYSEAGVGSTFKLYFPAVEGRALDSTKVTKKRQSRSVATILLIDDEPVVREMWGDFLSEQGYRIITAKDGQEGAGLFFEKKGEIDLVILDVVMPKLSGKETLGRIRGAVPDVKVLLTSGYSENGQAGDLIDLGVDGFIQKPSQLSHLAQKISEILKGKGKSQDSA